MKMVHAWCLGFFLVLCSAGCCCARHHEHKAQGKYPLELHQMFRDRISKSRPSKTEGIWSSWSPWTTCSRTCGGGVTMQTRECISRPADSRLGRGRRRKHLETNEVTNYCVGLYKRYHLCNPQECPKGRDFRAEQCASFNARPFRGRVYFWEPFMKVGDECALNCRAVGMGFYATLNQTAKDGTPCFHPLTSLLQMAPSGTRGVCVSGICKSVSAEGVIGAVTIPARSGPSPLTAPAVSTQQELCPACVTGCRTISGLFTRPQLPPGYSMVTQVPKGACRLVVAQLKHTKNFIALKNPNGTFILNGDPRDMGHNREIEAAGTRFIYRRQDSTIPETITASGPLSHPVDIMMVYNQPNPGIKYEFMIPVEQTIDHIAPPLIDARKPIESHSHKIHPHETNRQITDQKINSDGYRPNEMHRSSTEIHRHNHELPVEPRRLDKPLVTLSQGDDSRPLRRRRRKFVWKITGMTNCSRTCGGGVQYPMVVCVREHNQAVVLDRRCIGLERPYNQTQRCNSQPCVPSWRGEWSACSTTCGPGAQSRVLECSKELTATLKLILKESACLEPRPPTARRCNLGPCVFQDNELEQELLTTAQWHTEPWSQCSVSCGTGLRTRTVTCKHRCPLEDRPPHLEPCHGPPCTSAHSASPTIIQSHSPPVTSSAAVSWWMVTEWSEHCSQTCGTGTQTRWVTCPTGECEQRTKPDTSRACSSDKQCGGRWFTGPWGPCSEACGVTAKQTREVVCVVFVRGQARIVSDMTCPTHEKPVTEQICEGNCPPRWFTGEWGRCEGHCPDGVQRREVRCLEYDGRYSSACTQDMPALKRNCHCSLGLSTKTDYTSRESSQAQDEPLPDHHGCSDQINNCALVVQARLCQYPYYKTSCCSSCRRAQQD